MLVVPGGNAREGGPVETHDPELRRRANTLYWESDDSVNDIADKLDLSKGALYAVVQPLQTSEPCPECGTLLEFSNRTAREKGLVACPSCELEEELALVEAARVEASGGVLPVQEPESPTVRTVAAALLIGLAVGIAIGQWSRER